MTDQVSIATIIAHLERIESKVDTSTRRSDERHEETKRELKELRAEIKLLRANDELHQGAVKMAEERIRLVEDRMKRLEDEHHRTKTASIEGDEAQQAALVSAMRILSDGQDAMRAEFVEARQAQAAALSSLVSSITTMRLPLWAKVAIGFGLFVAGIVAGLISHGVIRF